MVGFFERYLFLIPLLPLLGAAANGIVGGRVQERAGRGAITAIGVGSVLASLVLSLAAFFALLSLEPGQRLIANELPTWMRAGSLELHWGFQLDPLSGVMLLVVSGIGFLIHVYSTGYMHHERAYWRFFAYMNLFMFAMLCLILGDSLPVMFLGWEGVGLCSYLLIGFWFDENANADAGKKAFLVNRIGDFGFILGIFTIFWALQHAGHPTLTFRGMQEHAGELAGVATAASLLLFVGATGKSAQIPLYVWLPDAMAGPTPVSALIHAATMVTAGIYMIARLGWLFAMSPVALTVVATVAALTALVAATIAVAQTDIKKVLAYSTVSQLGYMFLGLGVGAYAAGIFHLVTHAFFKALLFLGAGSVIHAMSHEQDMRKMGALRSHLPITSLTMFIGCLAIAGIPPFAGFFSKDEILWKTFSAENLAIAGWGKVLWGIGFLTAILTAFYMFRLYYLTFHGESRVSPEARAHLHESPASMTTPLRVLALGAIVAGFFGVPQIVGDVFGWQRSNTFEHFLAPVFEVGEAHDAALGAAAAEGHGHHNAGAEWALMLLSIGVAVLGWLAARRVYHAGSDVPDRAAGAAPGLYRTLVNKYYVDEFYLAFVVRPLMTVSRFLALFFDLWIVDGLVNGSAALMRLVSRASGLFDNRVVDGAVNGTGWSIRRVGTGLRLSQTGRIQSYLYLTLAAVAVVVIYRVM